MKKSRVVMENTKVNSLAMHLDGKYCGIVLRRNDARDMDSPSRRSFACGAQQYTRQIEIDHRFCTGRPQPPSSTEALVSIETESSKEYSQYTKDCK